jgi:hypothetical protein
MPLASSQNKLLIDSLNPHDVVLGRGQHVKHEGNSRFRTLVRSRAAEYHACTSKTNKDVIARQIVRVVEDLGGRFVRRAEHGEDGSTMVATSTWEIVDHSNVLVKVKQTFRDYSVVQRKAASAATAVASATSWTHDSTAPPHQLSVVLPNDQERPAVQPPSSLNSSAMAFNPPGVLFTHQTLMAPQDHSNTSLLISTLANQSLSQQSLGNYTIPATQPGPSLQSVSPASIGRDISNASDLLRSWTPEQLAQLQATLWQQILSNQPLGQIVGGLSNLAPRSSALQQSLLGLQPLTSPPIAATNWGFPNATVLSMPSALSPTLTNNALASWNSALGGAQVSAAVSNGHLDATTTTTATDQWGAAGR